MYFFILYGGPSDHFFAYYIGAPRSLSSVTICGPSDLFFLIQYGGPSQISFIVYYMPPPPQISFFACYRGATSHLGFFHKIYGGPLRSVSVHTFWEPLSDQFFLLLYGAPLRSVFSLTMGPPIRSVSSHTIWGGGGPQISFFAYYMWVP